MKTCLCKGNFGAFFHPKLHFPGFLCAYFRRTPPLVQDKVFTSSIIERFFEKNFLTSSLNERFLINIKPLLHSFNWTLDLIPNALRTSFDYLVNIYGTFFSLLSQHNFIMFHVHTATDSPPEGGQIWGTQLFLQEWRVHYTVSKTALLISKEIDKLIALVR